jgi:hypothetical protein
MKAQGLGCLLLSLALLPCSSAQTAPAESLTADQLAQKALEGDLDVFQSLKSYTFTKRLVVEVLDKKGDQKDRDERTYQYSPCDGLTCIKLLSVNGAAPTPKQLKDHDKVMKKELERQRKLTPADKQKESDEALFLSSDFLKIYTFTLGPATALTGDAAYVVDFAPHEQKVKLANKDNKVLSKMAGRMWLSKEQRVLSSEMHTVKSIKVWGGFAGSINNLQARLDYVRDAAGVYLPRRSETLIELRILVAKARWRFTEEYSDFIPPPAAAAAAKPD